MIVLTVCARENDFIDQYSRDFRYVFIRPVACAGFYKFDTCCGKYPFPLRAWEGSKGKGLKGEGILRI